MATEACRDWRGDLGLEALGRLEEPQRTALLAHLDGCADCRAALAELSTVARALDHADVTKVEQAELVQPSGELGDRILGRLQMERAARRRRRARGVVMSVAALAAAVVVAFALAFTVGSNGGDHGTVVALKSSLPGVHARAVLLAEDEGTRVKLHIDGLHDDGDWYWLWVTGPDGRRVGAGTFSAGNKQQDLTMTAALATSRAQRVWVTDESDRVVLDGRVKPS
jgi:anti-sigma-K factor RskA